MNGVRVNGVSRDNLLHMGHMSDVLQLVDMGGYNGSVWVVLLPYGGFACSGCQQFIVIGRPRF